MTKAPVLLFINYILCDLNNFSWYLQKRGPAHLVRHRRETVRDTASVIGALRPIGQSALLTMVIHNNSTGSERHFPLKAEIFNNR